jgi:hypothetical protein
MAGSIGLRHLVSSLVRVLERGVWDLAMVQAPGGASDIHLGWKLARRKEH